MINREDLLSGTRPEVGHRVLVTELDGFDGYEIMDYKGIVWGVSMRSKDVVKDMFMGLKTIIGGELESYTDLCNEVRQKALDRLIASARNLGANAVINFKFSQNMSYSNDNQVIAYGNAVVIRPIKNYIPTGGLGNLLFEFVDKYTQKLEGLQPKAKQTQTYGEIRLQEDVTPVANVVTVGEQQYVCCPQCHTKHRVKMANGKYYIAGLEDVDDIEAGCQVHCLRCGFKFTIPNS